MMPRGEPPERGQEAPGRPLRRGRGAAVQVAIVGLLSVSTAVFALLWLLGPLVGEGRRGGGRRIEARAGARALRVVEQAERDRSEPAVAVDARLGTREFESLHGELAALAASAEGAEHARAFFGSEAGRSAEPAVAFRFPGRRGPSELAVYAVDVARHLCYCRVGREGEPRAVPAAAYERLVARLVALGGGTVGGFALPHHVSLDRELRDRLARLQGPLAVTTVTADARRILERARAQRAPDDTELLFEKPDPLTVNVVLRLPEALAAARGLADALGRASGKVAVRHLDATGDRAAQRQLATDIGRPAEALEDVLVLQVGDRVRVIPVAELVRGGGAGAGQAFHGMAVIGRALDDLLAERGLLCFLEGHGERRVGDRSPGGFSLAAGELKGRGLRVRPLELSSAEAVPPDCTALVVPGPTRLLGPQAEGAIARYVEGGGRLALLLDPPDAPLVLAELLRRYGITVPRPQESLVASQGDLEPGLLLARVNRALDFTRAWEPGPAVFLTACELVLSEPAAKDTMQAVPVAHSLDPGAVPPPCLVGAARPRRGQAGPKLLVFGDVDAFSNRVLSSVGESPNLPLLRHAFLWLSE